MSGIAFEVLWSNFTRFEHHGQTHLQPERTLPKREEDWHVLLTLVMNSSSFTKAIASC